MRDPQEPLGWQARCTHDPDTFIAAGPIEHPRPVCASSQSEELADEVAHGSGTTLALWRWAALQAAAAPAGPGGSETKYERAVFGALGGSVAAAAAACSTWEDYAWLFCRWAVGDGRCARGRERKT